MCLLINKGLPVNLKELIQLDQKTFQIDLTPAFEKIKYGGKHYFPSDLSALNQIRPLFRPNGFF